MLAILPGTVHHAEALARNLRPGDQLECETLVGYGTVRETVLGSHARSLWCWTLLDGEEVAAMWGVVPLSLLGGRGQPWCLTTPIVERHRRVFARGSRAWLAHMRREFAFLLNWLDPRYATTVRWVQWLGFTIDPPAPLGAAGEPMCRFWMEC